MKTPQASPQPGWYHDPEGAPALRWWDGSRWTGQQRVLPDDASSVTSPVASSSEAGSSTGSTGIAGDTRSAPARETLHGSRWAPDPTGEAVWRWWDGQAWTTKLSGYAYCREQDATGMGRTVTSILDLLDPIDPADGPRLDDWRSQLPVPERVLQGGLGMGVPTSGGSLDPDDEPVIAAVTTGRTVHTRRRVIHPALIPVIVALVAIMVVLGLKSGAPTVRLAVVTILAVGIAVGYIGFAVRCTWRWSRYRYVAATDAAGATPGFQVLSGELHSRTPLVSPLSRTEAAWFTAGAGWLEPQSGQRGTRTEYRETHAVVAPRLVALTSTFSDRAVLLDCEGLALAAIAPVQVRHQEGQARTSSFTVNGMPVGASARASVWGEAVIPAGEPVTVFGEVLETEDGRLVLGGPPATRMLCFGDATVAERRAWRQLLRSVFGAVLAIALALVVTSSVVGAATPFSVLTTGLALSLGLGVALYLLGTVNGSVIVREQLTACRARIDVALTQRHDLIPALVATLQGATIHEASLQSALATLTASEADTFAKVVALSEQYPSLTADTTFTELFEELGGCEARIAAVRGTQVEALRLARDTARRLPAALWVRPLLRDALNQAEVAPAR